MEIVRVLVIMGIILVVSGLLWPYLNKIDVGRLPGDFVVGRERFRLYIPIMASLIVSVLLSVILWLLGR
jgi:hypothetical protein